MNCQEVETLITDLARNVAMGADARDGALVHIDECRRCGGRMAGEKRLTDGLLTWNAALIDEQAPPELEAALRAAFRNNAIPAPRRGWLKFAVAGSIAAAVLLFKLLTPASAPRPVPVAVMPAPQPQAPVVVAQVDAGDPPAKPARRRRRANPPLRAAPAEMGTEFLPVAQGDEWTPMDGGRMVRVGLPRSAMGVFGLPVDPGRAPERVQADVVLSDDGLLRAIRFVR